MDQIRGDDWTIDFPSLSWSDGTAIAQGELASASYRATVAGITNVTITPDPVSGVRLRIEVARELTVAVRAREKPYQSDVEITINNKRSTKLFDVTVLKDVTV